MEEKMKKSFKYLFLIMFLSVAIAPTSSLSQEKSVTLYPARTFWQDPIHYNKVSFLVFQVPPSEIVRNVKKFELNINVSKDAYCLLWIFPGNNWYHYSIDDSGSYILDESDWPTVPFYYWPRSLNGTVEELSFKLYIVRRPPLQYMPGSFAMLSSASLTLYYE